MTEASPPAHPQHLQSAQRVRARLQKIAYWLDGCIPVPGTRWRIGLEPIIGLVPVAGDIVGFLLSGFIIVEGIRVGAPPRLIARMLGITLLDALSGLVPVLGDVFDFAYKANRRNAELLMRHLDALEGRTQRVPRWRQLIHLALVLGVLGLLAWGCVRLFQLIIY